MTAPALIPSHGARCRPDASTIAAVLLAVTIPASIMIGRAASGVTIALAVIALAFACLRGRRLPVLPAGAGMLLPVAGVLVLAWLPSVIASLRPLASLGAMAQVLGCLLLGALALGLMAGGRARLMQTVFLAAFTLALAHAVLALTLVPQVIAFRAGDIIRAGTILKAAASIAVCAVPVLLLLGWHLGGRWRWCAVAAVLMVPVVMAQTHSKSSAAGLLAAGALALLLVATRRLRWPARVLAWMVAVAAGLAGLAWALSFTKPVVMGGFAQFAPVWLVDAHRQVIWQFALGLFAQRPWSGWGLGVINQAPGAGDKIPELGYEFIPSHTHDWVVQILSESGVVGALPVLLLVTGVAAVLIRRWYRDGKAADLAALGLWVTFWSAGLFNFSLWNAWWQSTLAILMAVTLSAAGSRSRS